MDVLFNPRSVAVIGASHKPGKVGHVVFFNLLRTFRGPVYPVNIKGGEILGKKVYRSVSELPETPDLVVVAIPAEHVPHVVEEAAKKGTKAFVVLSGGFGETGRKELDEELRHIAEEHDIYLVGPNCVGIYTPNMNATFLSPDRMDFPGEGGVSFLSQSGAMVAALLDELAREGIGVSKVVSLGNKLVLDEVDFLDYLGGDQATRVIVLYLEGVRRGRELYEKIREVAPRKPVIVLKGGKTSSGGRAATSHTESVLNDYRVFRGAMRQAGAIEAESVKELIGLLKGLKQPLPRGNRLLILTNGGGYGVLASDYVEKEGLLLPPWEEPVDLPPHIVQSNPFDLTGDATPEWYAEVLKRSGSYDAALAIIVPQTPRIDLSIVRALLESPVPVYAFVPGWKYADLLRDKLNRNGIPAFADLRLAVRVIAKLSAYSRRVHT